MQARVQKVGDNYVVMLPPQVVEHLHLVDGSAVEIRPADVTSPAVRYASVEEVMEIHRKMEPRHAAAYRELAK